MKNRKKGEMGEDLACAYIANLGHEVIKRNYYIRGGEIDIIYKDGETYVFTEVKYRKDVRYGSPAESVTKKKIRRISFAALDYIYENGLQNKKCRFDIIEVYGGNNEIRHIKNAFEADIKSQY